MPPDITAPRGYTITRRNGGIAVARAWRSCLLVWLVPFSLLWTAAVVLAGRDVLRTSEEPLKAIPFLLPFALIAIGSTYAMLANLLNRTIVSAANGVLTVRHRPLPWLSRTIPASKVFFVMSGDISTEDADGNVTPNHYVAVVLQGKGTVDVIDGLTSAADARTIERAFHDALGLDDALLEEDEEPLDDEADEPEPQTAPAPRGTGPEPKAPRGSGVPVPDNFTILREDGRLTIRRRWYTPYYVGLPYFVVVWDAITVGLWVHTVNTPGADTMPIMLPVVFGLFAILLTYSTLAVFLNRTDITLTEGRLTVRHYPVPWTGNQAISIAEIDQLYCEEGRSSEPGLASQWSVVVATRGGKRLTLADSLVAHQYAAFLEHEIEHALDIANRPVAGSQVICPSCGEVVSQARVRHAGRRLKCQACGMLLYDTPADAARPLDAPPPHITLTRTGAGLTIRWTWRNWDGIGYIASAIIGLGATVWILRGSWPLTHIQLHPLLVIPLAIIGLFFGLGIISAHRALALLLNHTDITVGGGRLTVRHAPIPWPGNQTIDTATIRQLFCEEYTVRHRHKNTTTIERLYRVCLETNTAPRFVLVEALQNPAQAAFIEQQLEAELGIANRRVKGEMRPA